MYPFSQYVPILTTNFLMENKIRFEKASALSLEELNKITGGRDFYKAEVDDYLKCLSIIGNKLEAMSDKEEAGKISTFCSNKANEGLYDIETAPDGSDPIFLSNYIKQYLE